MQVRTRTSPVALEDAMDAIASPRRRQILRLVWDGERLAGEIAAASEHEKPKFPRVREDYRFGDFDRGARFDEEPGRASNLQRGLGCERNIFLEAHGRNRFQYTLLIRRQPGERCQATMESYQPRGSTACRCIPK